MNLRRPLAAVAVLSSLLALAGCGPAEFAPAFDADNPPPRSHTSSPIIGGVTDGGDPAVVLVAYTNFLCTGTVIAPRVVLTAGHCTVVNDTCVPPNCVALSPGGYQIAGGTNPFSGADWVATVSQVHPNPGYNGQSLIHDMGILILSSDAPVTPLGWEDTATPYHAGQAFTAVGYGLANAPTGPDTSGTKRTVGLSIQQVQADAFAYGGATKNTCEGDSGGPALVNGKVIGTVSYGDQNCAQIGVDMRTDYEKAFIGQYASPGGTTVAKKKHGCSVDGSGSPASALPIVTAFGALVMVAVRRRREA